MGSDVFELYFVRKIENLLVFLDLLNQLNLLLNKIPDV
jgi:hypothetical protein